MKFYKNSTDDLHCFQAAMQMILSIYFPKQRFSLRMLERVTGFEKGKYTWHNAGLLWLAKKGFEIVRISDFDEQRFAREGEKYLKWYWRSDVYEVQKKMSNFTNEHLIARKLLPYAVDITKKAKVQDIDIYLKRGYVVLANINPRVLDRKKGYANHSVIVTRVTSSYVTFSDPGLPPQENRRVSRLSFQKGLHDLVMIRRKER